MWSQHPTSMWWDIASRDSRGFDLLRSAHKKTLLFFATYTATVEMGTIFHSLLHDLREYFPSKNCSRWKLVCTKFNSEFTSSGKVMMREIKKLIINGWLLFTWRFSLLDTSLSHLSKESFRSECVSFDSGVNLRDKISITLRSYPINF